MDSESASVELVAYFDRPIRPVYDTCFGVVAALHVARRSRARIGVYSRGLPHIPPEADWASFEREGRTSELYDECRGDLPIESEVGACHIEDTHDRWASAYCRDDKIEFMPADPFLWLSFDAGTPNNRAFETERKAVVNGLAASVEAFRVIDAAGNCYFGCVDVNANCFRGGQLYGNYPVRPLTWRQELEHVDWWSSGQKRRGRVREVYWGMYLSRQLLGRLLPDVLDRFLELETEDEGSQSVTRYSSGAAFLAMSADPGDAPFPFPSGPESPAVRNAAWLRQQLRVAGLL